MHVPPERLANPSKPTAVELAAVQRWQVKLNECFAADLQAVEAAGLSRRFGLVYSTASKDKAALLSLFAAGEMTYGEFNRRISELNVDNRKRLEDAREAFRRDLYHVEDGAPGYPLWGAADLVPRSREQLLLSRREQDAIAAYRRDTSYASADLFVANIAALNSNAISVSIDGKTYRIVGSRLSSIEKESWKWTERAEPLSEGPATVLSWTQSPTSSSDFSMSGKVVADGKLYEIATLGRFQVLLYRR
jgi:hypothetical protein